jgi:hypothetical protein
MARGSAFRFIPSSLATYSVPIPLVERGQQKKMHTHHGDSVGISVSECMVCCVCRIRMHRELIPCLRSNILIYWYYFLEDMQKPIAQSKRTYDYEVLKQPNVPVICKGVHEYMTTWPLDTAPLSFCLVDDWEGRQLCVGNEDDPVERAICYGTVAGRRSSSTGRELEIIHIALHTNVNYALQGLRRWSLYLFMLLFQNTL